MLKTFMKDGVKHRIGRRIRREYEHGYTEPSEEHYNVLQAWQKHPFIPFFWRWVDIEVEHVPACAWISQATLGYAEWKSSLVERYCIYL